MLENNRKKRRKPERSFVLPLALGTLLPLLLCVLLALPVYAGKISKELGSTLAGGCLAVGTGFDGFCVLRKQERGGAKRWGIQLVLLLTIYSLPVLCSGGGGAAAGAVTQSVRILSGMAVGGGLALVKSNKKYRKASA